MSESTVRILVTDDEDSVRDVALRSLEGEGRELRGAKDGQEAAEILGTGNWDLLVTDIKMPRMSGDRLIGEARKLHPGIQIIMMTGFPDLETAREGIRQGVYEYLMKPFDLADLKAAARRALEVQRLSRENKAYQSELEARYLKLMDYERTRNNLIGLVAGDLRGPLAKASMNLEILGEGMAGALAPDQAKLVNLGRDAVQKALSLAGDLADLRLAEQDDLFVGRVELGLAGMLKEKVERAMDVAKDEGKDLTLELEGQPGTTRGDESLVSRLLDNALIFSLKHTAPGGRVSVRLRAASSQIEAAFEGGDLGVPPGLSGTALARVLAAEPESSGLEIGEALSLAFCWSAVEVHGGRASLERPGPGKAVLRFSLPSERGR